jgi:hypothetical protein
MLLKELTNRDARRRKRKPVDCANQSVHLDLTMRPVAAWSVSMICCRIDSGTSGPRNDGFGPLTIVTSTSWKLMPLRCALSMSRASRSVTMNSAPPSKNSSPSQPRNSYETFRRSGAFRACGRPPCSRPTPGDLWFHKIVLCHRPPSTASRLTVPIGIRISRQSAASSERGSELRSVLGVNFRCRAARGQRRRLSTPPNNLFFVHLIRILGDIDRCFGMLCLGPPLHVALRPGWAVCEGPGEFILRKLRLRTASQTYGPPPAATAFHNPSVQLQQATNSPHR